MFCHFGIVWASCGHRGQMTLAGHGDCVEVASGEHTKNRWKITIFFFCKSTIKSHIHMFDDVGPGYRSLHIHCDVDE